MRIGITGATGFIGSTIGKLAMERGHEVVAYTRRPERCSLSWAAEVRSLDIAAALPLDASGLDVLIHLAGESILGLWTASKRERLRDSRVELTQRIARCLAEASPRPSVFLSGSGVGFYGDGGDEALTEASPRGHDFLADICVHWEAAAQRCEQLGVRVVLLRTGLVMGRDGGAFPMMKRAFRLCVGGRLGSGAQWMPWIHIDDEAKLILWAAENQHISGPLNLVSPEPVTNAEWTRQLALALHRPAFMHVPAFALKAMLGGLGSTLLGGQRALPSVAIEEGYEFQYPSLQEAFPALVGAI
jgi:uncharacterized protein